MFNVDYEIHNEHYKDLQRDAENERLVRQAKGQNTMLKNARKALGRGLVQAGQQLLNER